MLTVIDEYTREALCVAVRPKMNANDVLDVLFDLILKRGKPRKNTTYQDLRGDGHIVIYQRDVGANYYVRMKIIQSDGSYKYKTKSLKTQDQKEAARRGFEAYEDVSFHIKGGGQLDQSTYRDVFK